MNNSGNGHCRGAVACSFVWLCSPNGPGEDRSPAATAETIALFTFLRISPHTAKEEAGGRTPGPPVNHGCAVISSLCPPAARESYGCRWCLARPPSTDHLIAYWGGRNKRTTECRSPPGGTEKNKNKETHRAHNKQRPNSESFAHTGRGGDSEGSPSQRGPDL
jgi:hypothetical protein